MARPDPQAIICEHVTGAQPGDQPFAIDIVLDEAAGGIADALVQCRICGANYLLELLAWHGPQLGRRTFRVSSVTDSAATIYRRDVARGSCDLSRAGAERRAIEQHASLAPYTLQFDVDGMHIVRTEHLGADADICVASWRTTLLGG